MPTNPEQMELTTPEGRLQFSKQVAATLGLTPKNVLIVDPDQPLNKVIDRFEAYQKQLGTDVPLRQDLHIDAKRGVIQEASEFGASVVRTTGEREAIVHQRLDTMLKGVDSTVLLIGGDFNRQMTEFTTLVNQGKPIDDYSRAALRSNLQNAVPASKNDTSSSLSVNDFTKFTLRHEIAHAALTQADVLTEFNVQPTGAASKFLQSPYAELQKPSNQDKQKPSDQPMNPCFPGFAGGKVDERWQEMAADGVATLLSLQDGMSPDSLRKISFSRQNPHDMEHNSAPLMDRLLDKYQQKDLQGKSGQDLMQIVGKELKQVWLEPSFYNKYKQLGEQSSNASPQTFLESPQANVDKMLPAERLPTSQVAALDHQKLWQASIDHGNAVQENQSVTRTA